jgi:threonine aldolase
MESTKKIAAQWGLPVHLDGARIFNAALALGCTARDIADNADSVMFCLSKGLCAPVGSLLAGSKAFIEEARLKRKIMGGGMRQAGILAAAGIIALKDHPAKLAEDHAGAKELAKSLGQIKGIVIDPGETEINMVFFKVPAALDPARLAKMMEVFSRHKILINAPEQDLFRFVTHYWIRDRELKAIAEAAKEAFEESN